MFQASAKSKGKNVETNYVDDSNPVDVTHLDVSHLDVSDLFENKDRKINHLIGDGNVLYN